VIIFETYERADDLFDWRAVSEGNHETLTGTSQGFGDRHDAHRSIVGFVRGLLEAVGLEGADVAALADRIHIDDT
jgi:hypothetical protein